MRIHALYYHIQIDFIFTIYMLLIFTNTVLQFAGAVEACQRNVKFNGSVACSKVESQLADARVYMLTHPKEFDVVLHLTILYVKLTTLYGNIDMLLCLTAAKEFDLIYICR